MVIAFIVVSSIVGYLALGLLVAALLVRWAGPSDDGALLAAIVFWPLFLVGLCIMAGGLYMLRAVKVISQIGLRDKDENR